MKKRVEYIDILRAIGIIYMVMGHIFTNQRFDHYIHAFHMPLFYFVSGLFFKDSSKNTKDFIKKTTKALLLPYLFCSLFYFLIACITHYGLKENIWVTFLQIITINNDGFVIATALWFLTSMYFSRIFFFFIQKLCKKESLIAIFSISLMLLGIYFEKLFSMRLWLSIDTSFVGVGLMYLGYIIKKAGLLDKMIIKNVVLCACLFILNYWMIFKTSYVNMRTSTYPNPIFFLINFLVAMVLYLSFSKWLLGRKSLKKVNKVLENIGKNSIVYLCFNQIALLIFDKIVCLFIKNNLIANSITTLLTIASLYVFSKFLFKSKCKVLFGK